jgi:hypothetical protein
MLDFVHRVDPDLAAELASLADTDPARVRTRIAMRQQLDVLNGAKALGSQSRKRDESPVRKRQYPQVAWRLLGQLHAGRVAHRKLEEMREFVTVASSLAFTEAYPVLAFVIRNAVTRFSNTDQASSVLRPMFEATLLASHIAARLADQNNRLALGAFPPEMIECGTPTADLVKAGQRSSAVRRIERWIEEKVGAYLTICDPYFGPEDLEILTLILNIKPLTRVRILTSLKHQQQEKVPEPYAHSYVQHWRTAISAQGPPDTEVTIAGTKSGGSPIHDRWWLIDGAGLRMGTSFRSIGVEKDAELSDIPSDTAATFEAQVKGYLNREIRELNGERLSYQSFTLD